MGTNYYLVRNRPTVEEPIHIGKSSMGWRFHFQSQNLPYSHPPIVWNTYEQVMSKLQQLTVYDKSHVIMDEYDKIVPFEDLKELVDAKQNNDNPDNFSNCRNINEYRFSDYDFC